MVNILNNSIATLLMLQISVLFFVYQTPVFQIYFGSTVVATIKWFCLFLTAGFFALIVKNFRVPLPRFILGYFFVLIAMVPCALFYGLQGFEQFFKISTRVSYVLFFLWAVYIIKIRNTLVLFECIGILLSLQSIILYFLIILKINYPPVYLERFGDGDLFPSYGILGFGSWLSLRNDGSIAFRVQSFFSEANKFSMFLFLPLFILIGRAGSILRNLKMLVVILCTALTFSFTAFLSLGWAWLIYYISKNIALSKKGFFNPIVISLLCTVLVVSVMFWMVFNESTTKFGIEAIDIALNKDMSSFEVRIKYIKNVLKILNDYPFGVPETVVEASIGKLPMAPIRWFIWSGYLGGISMLIVQFTIFKYIFIPCLRSNNSLEVSIAACCIAIQFASINHGNWTDFEYFISIAILLNLRAERTNKILYPISPTGKMLCSYRYDNCYK